MTDSQPGETVMIPDAEEVGSGLALSTNAAWCVIDPVIEQNPAGVPIWLDANGVVKLREACDRWLAGQNQEIEP